jgi:hypothetical protein
VDPNRYPSPRKSFGSTTMVRYLYNLWENDEPEHTRYNDWHTGFFFNQSAGRESFNIPVFGTQDANAVLCANCRLLLESGADHSHTVLY